MFPSWRAITPWALLALVLVGAGIGAAIGHAGAPLATSAAAGTSPAQWVDQVLATTKEAGTAHFTYRSTTTSSTARLNTSQSGSGAVDFAARRLRVTTTIGQYSASQGRWQPHQVTTSPESITVITIGTQTWEGFGGQWTKIRWPRNPDDRLGLNFGSEALLDIEGALPIKSVHTLGPARVGGVDTTRYLVTSSPPRPCNAQQSDAMRGSSIGPTTIWVDGHGRLVRASLTTHAIVRVPASFHGQAPADFPRGPINNTQVVQLGQFGAPVHVAAPTAADIRPVGSSSVVISAKVCH